jgi:tRNA-2-methylthio-N6-dimethylallyladenosine synthase
VPAIYYMKPECYIETMGCQMNKLDSELVRGRLEQLGYRFTSDPSRAGVIIFNTCSVRQHAEDKVISKIGQLRRRHQDDPELILAVIGCMAQRLGSELLSTYRQVDVVCGPGQLHRLPLLIEQAIQNRQGSRMIAIDGDGSGGESGENDELEEFDTGRSFVDTGRPFQAFLRIMRGCNNFCSYCIVPYVRGPERSRPINNIVDEARRLVSAGVKEITLLGQAVNKYQFNDNGEILRLADVLESLNKIDGLRRLRFVTNYPSHFDDRIFRAMADLESVCPYLHICAQSGSNRVLRAMNRRYTVEEYIELIERARDLVPGITVAGDFIVGFPGETDGDFRATAELMRRVRYKNCFIFKYSPRPGTATETKLADDVPLEVKKSRNWELLALQNEIAFEDNQKFIGQKVEILVEGHSKKSHLNATAKNDGQSPDCKTISNPQLIGRTGGDHIVVFNGPETLIGQIADVTVNRASALTLFAKPV